MSKEYHFIPIEECIELIASGRHQFACLEGDMYGQVHTPDLNYDQVYIARVCKVCGTPFVDGREVVKPIDSLDTYIAEESEAKQPSLDHLHAKNLKTGGSMLFYMQPNTFLRGYKPTGTVIETYNTREAKEEAEAITNFLGSVPLMFLPVLGKRWYTEGSSLLEKIYREYYPNDKPLPPKLFQLIRESKGEQFYQEFVKSMENNNKISLRTKVGLKTGNLRIKFNLALSKLFGW